MASARPGRSRPRPLPEEAERRACGPQLGVSLQILMVLRIWALCLLVVAGAAGGAEAPHGADGVGGDTATCAAVVGTSGPGHDTRRRPQRRQLEPPPRLVAPGLRGRLGCPRRELRQVWTAAPRRMRRPWPQPGPATEGRRLLALSKAPHCSGRWLGGCAGAAAVVVVLYLGHRGASWWWLGLGRTCFGRLAAAARRGQATMASVASTAITYGRYRFPAWCSSSRGHSNALS